MKPYKFHPLSDIFPLLDGDETRHMAEDIKQNGLREKITLFNNQILDGRNRYRACLLAEVEPTFREFPGGDPVAFIVSANLRRRHLDTSQRAIVAAKLATAKKGGSPEQRTQKGTLTSPQAAEMLNVSEHSVDRAKKVLSKAEPEDVKAIEKGKTTIGAVEKKIDQSRNQVETLDAYHRKVPDDLVAEWKRAEAEGHKIRSLMSSVKNLVADGINNKDVIYSELLNPTLAEIDALRYTLGQVIPYALCPSCQGRARKKCTRCKSRGWLSKYLFNSTASKTEKEMAEKSGRKK